MTKKNAMTISSVAAGISGAAAVHQWPEHAVPVQMSLYSVAIALLLTFHFWPDRHSRKCQMGALLALPLHAATLYMIRSCFPFGTILTVIPILFVETVLLALVIIKMRGPSETESQ